MKKVFFNRFQVELHPNHFSSRTIHLSISYPSLFNHHNSRCRLICSCKIPTPLSICCEDFLLPFMSGCLPSFGKSRQATSDFFLLVCLFLPLCLRCSLNPPRLQIVSFVLGSTSCSLTHSSPAGGLPGLKAKHHFIFLFSSYLRSSLNSTFNIQALNFLEAIQLFLSHLSFLNK